MEFLGDVAAHQNGRHRTHCRRFGRVGKTAQNGADDHDRDQQRGAGCDDGVQALFDGAFGGAGVVIDQTHTRDHDKKQHREDHAGDDARDQHVAHRHLRQHAVDHKHHRRRNDGAEHAAIHREPGGKGLVVTLLLHLGHHDLAHDGDLCGGRTNDRRHQHVRQNVHIGQATLDRTNKGQ